MASYRIDRLEGQLQQEIALIIHQQLKDPRLGFVTVIGVELSKDLSHAKVLFSCLGDVEQRQRCQEGLDRSAGFVRSLIKKRFRLKVIPEIHFQYDESIAGSIAISELLDQVKAEEHRRENDSEGREG